MIDPIERFQRFFGRRVCIQLRESVVLCVADGEGIKAPVMDRLGNALNERGKPVDPASAAASRELAHVVTWPIKPSKQDDSELTEFTLIIADCVLLPTAQGCLSVHYEYKGAMLELDIDPALIVAVTCVSAVRSEPRIVGSA